MNKELLKNSFVYVLGDVLNKSIPFFMLPILTRYLTPEDYGLISIFGVLVSVLAVFTGLSVHGAVNVNFFRISKEELKQYIGNVFIILSCSTSVVFVVVLILHSVFSRYTQLTVEWIFVAVIVASAQFITTINLLLWMAEQKPKLYSLYQLSQTLFITALSIVFIVALNMNWEGQLFAQSVGILLFAGVSLLFLIKRKYLVFNYNKEHIREALKFGIPLVPHQLASWLKTGADRVLLMTLVGSQATGIYSVGYQVGMIISVLATAFNKAWSPYMFRVLSSEPSNKEKKKIVKMTYSYFVFIFVFAICFALGIKYIVPIFLGEKFAGASEYVFYISVAFSFQGMYFMVTNYIFYEKKTHILAYITFSTAVLHVTMTYLLVSMNGAIGAAQASVVSFFITFVATWFLSSKVYPMPWLFWSEK